MIARGFVVADEIVDGVSFCPVVANETDDVVVDDATIGPDVGADSDIVERIDVVAAVGNDIDVVEDEDETGIFLAFK